MERRAFLLGATAGAVLTAVAYPLILPRRKKPEMTLLEKRLFPLYAEVDEKFPLNDEERVLLVDGSEQEMYLAFMRQGEFTIDTHYDISTGEAGFGNEPGSKKTPTGIHKVKERFGAGAPIGTIFDIRRRTEKIATSNTNENDPSPRFITSRIMWLEGCEEENEDSYFRQIYIHGTNKRDEIGEPTSNGCIRMKDEDVVEVFDLTKVGTYANIRESIG
tara:strand:+ start:77 stop:730 length:654 start_codon:yes stop_codon:yes gene_type:complete